MSDWLAPVLLGLIEGITEFLPVSSTGHLLIAEQWLPRQSDLFNTVIQSGAVLAVVLVFAGRLRRLAAEWRTPEAKEYLVKLGAAFGVTGVGGLILKQAGWVLPEAAGPVIWATLIGGLIILAVEARGFTGRKEQRLTWVIVLAVGLAQLAAAVFPGLSRSAATIMVALVLGLDRPRATEFSFLVGVPTLLAAGGLEMYSALKEPAAIRWEHLFLGFFVATATGFASVKWLLGFIQTHTFVAFGWYRIALGVVLLLIL